MLHSVHTPRRQQQEVTTQIIVANASVFTTLPAHVTPSPSCGSHSALGCSFSTCTSTIVRRSFAQWRPSPEPSQQAASYQPVRRQSNTFTLIARYLSVSHSNLCTLDGRLGARAGQPHSFIHQRPVNGGALLARQQRLWQSRPEPNRPVPTTRRSRPSSFLRHRFY